MRVVSEKHDENFQVFIDWNFPSKPFYLYTQQLVTYQLKLVWLYNNLMEKLGIETGSIGT